MTTTTQYLYTGPTTGITIRGEKGEKIEKMLFKGKTVDLPDCPPVQTLIALKRLAPVPASTTTEAATSAASTAAPVTTAASTSAATAAQITATAETTTSTAAATSTAEQQKGA